MQVLEEKCPHCDATQYSISLHCNSCSEPLGYPNVRLSNLPIEIAALNQRLQEAKENAAGSKLDSEFNDLLDSVNQLSNVVIAMPVEIALQMVTDVATQYVGYERLIGAGARSVATFANDTHRKVVSGAIFGSSGDQIIYGALSLSDRGLRTYGDVYCKLKRITIENRVSFLEDNSYEYYRKYSEIGKPGCKADWSNRSKLVAVKLSDSRSIKKGKSQKDWEILMLVCDGKNRNLDEFIEAHIYGSFNIYSIESLTAAEHIEPAKIKFVEVVLDAFNSKR